MNYNESSIYLFVECRDGIQRYILCSWLEKPEFLWRMLPIGTAVALRCTKLYIPIHRGECDTLIAATVLVHGMTLVTRNLDDFEPTGVQIINSWTS